jgi:hypothetical protein
MLLRQDGERASGDVLAVDAGGQDPVLREIIECDRHLLGDAPFGHEKETTGNQQVHAAVQECHRLGLIIRPVLGVLDEPPCFRQTGLGYDFSLMATHPSHILELARKGAEHRHEELKAEIAALIKTFPHLREGQASVRKSGSVKPGKELAAESTSTPTRAKWSAAAKKAVSLRMKKYWAARRAAEKK